MRLVIHVDLDAFYCQVEHKRLNIPKDKPLAVQQWNSVIAVNYAARASGVTRHLSASECLQKCPEILLAHVATIGIDELLNDGECGELKILYHDAQNGLIKLDSRRCKASLDPYRRASKSIFAAIENFLKESDLRYVVEKASVDEAFIEILDLEKIDSIMEQSLDDQEDPIEGCPIVKDCESKIEPNKQNMAIKFGCRLATDLRYHVHTTLGFTMSAGIAKNKTLAKLASACNKPDNQTFVLDEHIDPLMRVTPFEKIRFLGGKLGDSLRDDVGSEDDDADSHDHVKQQQSTAEKTTAFDLQALTVDQLRWKVNDLEQAKWVFGVIRGEDPSPVIPRSLTKSFMSAKQHRPPLKDVHMAVQWLKLLAGEAWGRALEEYSLNHRAPSTVTFYYRRPGQNTRSKAVSVPASIVLNQSSYKPLFDHVYKRLWLIVQKEQSVLPVNLLGVSLSRFKEATSLDQSIEGFLRNPVGNSPWQFIDSTKSTVQSVEYPGGNTTVQSVKRNQARGKHIEKEQNNMWRCTRCATWFYSHQQEKIQEHQDHHMAMDMARDYC